MFRPVARGGSVGSEELPSPKKGPLSCNERSTFKKIRSTFQNKRSTVITRDVGIGPADLAAARLEFHPQLKIVVIN